MYASQSVAEKLLEKGTINADQFSAARSESLRKGVAIEDVLQTDSVVSGVDIAKAKSEIYGIPFVDLLELSLDKDVISKISADVARRQNAIPFRATETAVEIAMKDPLDIQAVNYLSKLIGQRIIPYYADSAAIEKVIDSQYKEEFAGEVTEVIGEVEEDKPKEIEEQISDIGKVEEEIQRAPVARIINMMLEYAVKTKASDIHIEPSESKLRVRMRIHGVLVQKLEMPMSVHPALVSRIKILSKLKIDEKRVPQDGRFGIKLKGKEVDLRVSTLPTIDGEKVVVRLLDRSSGIFNLEETGLRGSAFKSYLDALSLTTGIVLVTGPTGSGKTQTLASSLDRINTEKINIITLENPVEIKIPGVNQVNVNPDAGLTFASGLRSILRQDPDVVMVGEIRDGETARLAMQASLTGHLVFSTLHTNSAAGALPRLIDMGIEPYLIASTVHLVAAQRLPRKICSHCMESYVATPEIAKEIVSVLDNLKIDIVAHSKQYCPICKAGQACPHSEIEKDEIPDIEQLILFRGKGCEKCEGTGYAGRIGIYEVLNVTDKIGKLVMEQSSTSEIDNLAREEGMITMTQDGYLKALEGVTTIEEVLRVSKA